MLKGEQMEIAITKISPNGQIVIPSNIRKEAGIGSSSKFIIVNEGKNILLKHLNEEALNEEIEFIRMIARAEQQIKEGKVIVADTKMSNSEILKLLKKKKK
jgi:AbrB family looped-hinge helix DNA binding protein